MSRATVERMLAWDTEHKQLLVRKILEGVRQYEWSLQGFGMFRLYLSKRTRLHVWVPSFAVPNVSTIHTHPWHFRSEVIAGSMVDRLYERSLLRLLPISESATHHMQKIVCGPGGCAIGNPEPVVLRHVQDLTITVGKAYSLTAEAFHESIPSPGTVTIVDREFLEDTEHAHVCFPFGTRWESAEPRRATQKEIDAMAEIALERLSRSVVHQ